MNNMSVCTWKYYFLVDATGRLGFFINILLKIE